MPSNWDEMTIDEKLEWLMQRLTALRVEMADDFRSLRRRIEALESSVPAPALKGSRVD